MNAVMAQVPAVKYASPAVALNERIAIGAGKEKDILVMGTSPDYARVRNLIVPSGRFFDLQDQQAHNKVAVITVKMAEEFYGSNDAAIGKIIKLSGLPFTIIGTFKESVDTFGQSEVQDYTMVIPYTVSRYFTETAAVKQIFFAVGSSDDVIPATDQIGHIIRARHRPESVFTVSNLTQLLTVADKTANALTMLDCRVEVAHPHLWRTRTRGFQQIRENTVDLRDLQPNVFHDSTRRTAARQIPANNFNHACDPG